MRAAELVIIFRPSDRSPVFHRWGEPEYEHHEMPSGLGEERRSRYATICGQLLSEVHWHERFPAPNGSRKPHKTTELDRERQDYVHVRFDNASLIGRPCRRCFPAAEFGRTTQAEP